MNECGRQGVRPALSPPKKRVSLERCPGSEVKLPLAPAARDSGPGTLHVGTTAQRRRRLAIRVLCEMLIVDPVA